MKIPKYDPNKQRTGEEIPESTMRAISTIDEQLKTVSDALQGRLGIENFAEEEVELPIFHNTATTIRLRRLGVVPRSGELVFTAEFSPTRFTWRILDRDEVEVLVFWDSIPSNKVGCRFRFRT